MFRQNDLLTISQSHLVKKQSLFSKCFLFLISCFCPKNSSQPLLCNNSLHFQTIFLHTRSETTFSKEAERSGPVVFSLGMYSRKESDSTLSNTHSNRQTMFHASRLYTNWLLTANISGYEAILNLLVFYWFKILFLLEIGNTSIIRAVLAEFLYSKKFLNLAFHYTVHFTTQLQDE